MIGLIGLGQMGGAIARRLLEVGLPIVVFDDVVERVAGLVPHGARPAESVKEVGDQASIVMTCLPSGAAAKDVAKKLSDGKLVEIYVELSTIGRHAVCEIAEILRRRNIELVDAPVSGGPLGATRGTLAVMMSGKAAAIARVIEQIGPMAGKIVQVGPEPGQAQLCKLINNGISMTAFLVSCEAVAMGVAHGIDAHSVLDAVNVGTGRNSATVDKIPLFILPRSFNMGGKLGSAIKDLDLYLQEARAAGLPEGMVSATRAVWMKAIEALDPAEDAATIIRYFEQHTGAEVVG